jgi:hypothetical protein
VTSPTCSRKRNGFGWKTAWKFGRSRRQEDNIKMNLIETLCETDRWTDRTASEYRPDLFNDDFSISHYIQSNGKVKVKLSLCSVN